MHKLLASPMRPSTPSHHAAPCYVPASPRHGVPASPLRLPSPRASPRASPRHAGGLPPLLPPQPVPEPLLSLPPASPHRLSPHDAALPLHGEHRAMAEWTRAVARHASPYIGLAPASPYVGNRMASPAPHGAHGEGPTLEGSERPTRVARHISPAGPALPSHGAGVGVGAGAGAGAGVGPAGADASAGGGEAADASSWGYWQLRRSPAQPATDPRSSPCWSGPSSFPSSLPERPGTDPRRSPFVGSGASALLRQSPRQSPRHAPGAMLPPPPRATKKEGGACSGAMEMTDDDMNSWLLNGAMAEADNPGGWQYGSHLELQDSLVEPAAEPTAEPAAEPAVAPAADPAADPAAEPVASSPA